MCFLSLQKGNTQKHSVWKHSAFPLFWCSLTSTVHKFPDMGGGHDLVGAEIVGKLATDGDNDGHNQMGKCGQYAHLEERER